MNEINVRIGDEEDRAALGPINESSLKFLRQFYLPRSQALRQKADRPSDVLVIAETDSEIVGTCEYYLEKDRLSFASLGVREEWRGRGVFRQIFDFLEAQAYLAGCKSISCWTVEATGNAQIFGRVGMKVVEREESKLFDSPDGSEVYELRLEKRLR